MLSGRAWSVAVAVGGLLLPALGAAQEEPAVAVGGLVDLRFARTGDTRGWLDEGLGKTRYGAGAAGAATLARLSQASLLVDATLGETLSAHLQLNADADPDPAGRLARVGLVEAFASWRPEPSPHLRLRARVGAFFPPVSLENEGPAWTNRYTISNSAIDSWVGEELRTVGAEGTLVIVSGRSQLGLGGASYGSNDPAGSLLAWRGWAVHDRQTAFGEELPLAPIPSLSPGGVFAGQPRWVEPLREVDGRLGWYAHGFLRRDGLFEARGLAYDNRGRKQVFDGKQYAWHTRFTSTGLRLELAGRVELLGQYMSGTTLMGIPPGIVDARFESFYALLAARAGKHRLALRYDDFQVEDRDGLGASDDNTEDGRVFTAAYAFEATRNVRLALELLRVESDRPVRAALALPVHAEETLVQASLRFAF